MTPDPRIEAAARVLADYLKSHGYDLGDCKEMLRVAGYEALVRDNASARAELGRIQAALAEFVDAIGPWALSVVHGEGPVRDAVHAARRARDGMSA